MTEPIRCPHCADDLSPEQRQCQTCGESNPLLAGEFGKENQL
jgi:hypothetical protein